MKVKIWEQNFTGIWSALLFGESKVICASTKLWNRRSMVEHLQWQALEAYYHWVSNECQQQVSGHLSDIKGLCNTMKIVQITRVNVGNEGINIGKIWTSPWSHPHVFLQHLTILILEIWVKICNLVPESAGKGE